MFKNQNRPIPAGESYPVFVFEFFDVRTLLSRVRQYQNYLPHKTFFQQGYIGDHKHLDMEETHSDVT